MAIRTATKLTAGVGATVYTVPAGKSATVSVQVQNPTGFILAAQQTAISANPLVNTFSSNTANVTTVLSSNYWTSQGQTNAFNTTNGANTPSSMRVVTFSQNGATITNVSTNIFGEITLDYRINLPSTIVATDGVNGSFRGMQFNTATYPLPTLYTYPQFTYSSGYSPTQYAQATGASSPLGYANIGAVAASGYAVTFSNNGYHSYTSSYNSSGNGTVYNVASVDPNGNTNILYDYLNNNGYLIGNNTPAIVYGASGNIGVFLGCYKTGAAPIIYTVWNTSYLDTFSSGGGQWWRRNTLSGPANGTCPLWMRFFGSNYYVGMSDGTMWKFASSTNPFSASANTSQTITCTQVTVAAGVDINRRPTVVSATEMHFGMTSGKFPMVMNTSEVFSAYPNATYPAELAFASTTVPNPKIISKYGATVNEYVIIDDTSVYRTVANYSTLGAESYLINGRYGDFERTGLVLNSGDKLIAVEPTDSNCIVTVYGYEE